MDALMIPKTETPKLYRYRKFCRAMQTGDCLAYRSNSILGWLIRLFSRGDINHVGLVIRLPRYEKMADRRWTLEALEHGITLNLLSRRLNNFKGQVYWYRLRDEYELYRDAIGTFATYYADTDYDYSSLFEQIWARIPILSQNDKFFCSEYVWKAYEAVGIPLPELSHIPQPKDIPSLGVFYDPIQIL